MYAEEILRDLAVMFVAAKLTGALFERLRQPAVIGEVLAGVVLGPNLLHLFEITEAHVALQELGAIVLLFAVGLDTPLSELKAVGSRSLAVGASGIVLPFALGMLLLWVAGYGMNESLFMGTAMVATSVGVTARVLADLGRVREPVSRVILGAAVVDDVLGLLVLTVVVALAGVSISVTSILLLVVMAICFVLLVGGLGPRFVEHALPFLDRLGEQGVFIVALGLCLVLASTAGAIGLAAIIGAFLAGMALAETRDRYKLEQQLAPVYSFLVPFFFVVTGALVDLEMLGSPATMLLTLAVIAVAITGKLVGCGLAARGLGRRAALIVGFGMVPRGEVGILVASIGLARGIINGELYSVVVAMSIATTLVAPPFLTALFGRSSSGSPRDRHSRSADVEGIGG